MTPEQEVCWKAAKLIERYGWTQGQYGDTTKGFCLAGACHQANGQTRLPDIIFKLKVHPVYWNDNKRRTAEDVIDFLVACAHGDFT